jgi:tetratricopeptide (TPR) repeat protein
VSQITGKVAYDDPDHPGPLERSQFVRSQLAAVADDLSLFSFGVHLYRIGNYEAAIALLEKFREKFPSREVFNNIGLSYYQLAMGTLSVCDKKLPVRFKLSTVLDTSTLASRLITRGKSGEESLDCYQNEKYRSQMAKAINRLKEATEKDPFYIPAKINLSSAYIMSQQYLEAKVILKNALRVSQDNPRALNNKAVADYLEGKESGDDVTNNALSTLNRVVVNHPGFSDAFYNGASIEIEANRTGSKKSWQAFLRVEPDGAYAAEAKSRLDLKQDDKKAAAKTPFPQPPVMTGDISSDTSKILKRMKIKNVTIGDDRYEIYQGKKISVLVINGSVALIEVDVDELKELREFEQIYGKPDRTLEHVSGNTLIYGNFAADVLDGKIRQIIYFENQGRDES